MSKLTFRPGAGHWIKAAVALMLVASTALVSASEVVQLERGVFTVDGRNLSFFCAGEGSPTLVLEAPSGISNEDAYTKVLAGLVSENRVCAYERAHYGSSDPLAPGVVQNVEDYSKELKRFLSLESVPPPYLFVGFSYGGFVTRYYTGHNPQNVVGMVLIDSPHVRWLRTMKQEFSEDDWAKVEDIIEWFLDNRGHDVWQSQFMVEQAPALPDDLPIAIIVRDQDHETMRQSGISEAGFRLYNDIHFDLAPELLGLSENTMDFRATNSDHMIPEHDPDIVLEAVQWVLQSIDRKQGKAEAAKNHREAMGSDTP